MERSRLLCALLIGVGTGTTLVADERVEALIAHVQEAERLYQSVDIRFSTECRETSAREQSAEFFVERRVKSQHVAQGHCFKSLDEETVVRADGQKSVRSNLVMFDGETVRTDDGRGLQRISSDAWARRNIFHPHALLSVKRFRVPLSANLQGFDSIVDPAVLYSESDESPFRYFEPRILDEDAESAGLRCVKIQLGQIDGRPGRRRQHILLWLAKERNYVPVRMEMFPLPVGFRSRTVDVQPGTLPVRVAAASDFREIADGVWFPFQSDCVAYNPQTREKEKRLSVA